MLHELSLESLGKFLIRGEVLGRLGFLCCESCCDGNALLCVVLVRQERWRHLQLAIYVWGSHHVPPCTYTLFSASLPLRKWKWSCGAVWLSGWSVAVALQQAPRVKYFSQEKATECCSLAFVCQAALICDYSCHFIVTLGDQTYQNET